MSPITPVKYTTPDGVERALRFTFGAQRRIVERLGCTAVEALQKYENAALPDMLYACMFDEYGKPPLDLDPVVFAETADPESAAEMMAAFMSAVTKGKSPKNELEALIREAMEKQFSLTTFGSQLGVSLESASGSPTQSSGTLRNGNSTPSAISSVTNSESVAGLPASLQPQ